MSQKLELSNEVLKDKFMLRKYLESKYERDRDVNFAKSSELYPRALRSIFFTTNIENEQGISLKGTRAQIIGLDTGYVDKSSRQYILVENMMSASSFLSRMEYLSTRTLLLLHEALMQGVMQQGIAGEFKTFNNTIGGFEDKVRFTDAENVYDEVEKWVNKYNSTLKELNTAKDKLDFIFDLKSDFIAIHPFGDGNGRMVRLLLQWMLYKEGFFVPTFRGWDRDDYGAAMFYDYMTADMFAIKDMYLQECQIDEYINQDWARVLEILPKDFRHSGVDEVVDYLYKNYNSLKGKLGWTFTTAITHYE